MRAATARYSVYYGEGRDAYDVRGRVAHESVFNTNDGDYRCPNSQQGYSPFSTWTRGLAWAMCGFAEQLEFLEDASGRGARSVGGSAMSSTMMRKAAEATCDFYIENTPPDGIPYWDTGAPGLAKLGDWREPPADPFNDHEPVDSSAAAIAAQGLLRLGTLSEERPIPAGRPDGREYALRRAVSEHRPEAPGPDAACRVSPAERLGLHSAGQKVPVRRILHVGRLSRARSLACIFCARSKTSHI